MKNNLVGIRKSINHTQDDFAKILKTSRPTYSNKEKEYSDRFTGYEMKRLTNYINKYYPEMKIEDIFFK